MAHRRAFAYLRVSGKGQVEGDGFTRQLKAIRDYAKAHNIRLVKVFREEGVSGALEHRPALTALLEALHGNGVRLVLIERIDRLARDLMVQESIIADLRRSEFELISVTEPDLLQDDPSRIAFRQIMGVFAQYEKTMIVLKLRAARQRKRAKEGRCEGRKPYGYRPGEKRVTERMRALRNEGLGFYQLAKKLNEEGFRTRKGTEWHGFGVNRILSRSTCL